MNIYDNMRVHHKPFIPLAVYSIIYLVSFSHALAILGIGEASVSELAVAIYELRQNKKKYKTYMRTAQFFLNAQDLMVKEHF